MATDNFSKTIATLQQLISTIQSGDTQVQELGKRVKDLGKSFEALKAGQITLQDIVAELSLIRGFATGINLQGLLPTNKLDDFNGGLSTLRVSAQKLHDELLKLNQVSQGPTRIGGGRQYSYMGGEIVNRISRTVRGVGPAEEGESAYWTKTMMGRVSGVYDSPGGEKFRTNADQITQSAKNLQKIEEQRSRELEKQAQILGDQLRSYLAISQQKYKETGERQAGYGEFLKGGTSPYLDAAKAQENLSKELDKYGMSLGNVTSVQKDAISGTARITAEMKNADDQMTSVTLTQDRLGRVSGNTAGSFRTMAQEVTKSVAQFAKFMVSATLVYGILNLLSEQSKVVVENQTQLANIAVVLGNNQQRLAQIYEYAAETANYASESITGVLRGYQQALRVTGNVADENERVAKANLYLRESLVLSKLSTLDQAKSMDILIAALSQSGTEIESARDLLDRWVATTRIANVDMRTLAESYAIVATVAQSAGIEVQETNNELVGLIAVLAEQTQLTPTETGNALRAVITGLNTDEAISQLRNFGIAVTDVNGEMRDFFDITTDIHQAWRAGLISDSELSRLSRSIGGGTRRQAQVEVILKELDRAFEINEQSANRYGSAEQALTTRTDTLQDAITRLGNAFQELGQVWGVDGGALDAATGLVEMLTLLLDVVEKLSKVLGPNTLSLFGSGIVAALASAKGRFPLEGITSAIDRRFATPLPPAFPGGAPRGYQPIGAIPSLGIAGRTPGQWAAQGAGAFVGAGLPAAVNFMQGNSAEGFGNLIGGTLGAAAGAAFGAPQIGAILGSTAGGAFASSLTTIEGDLTQAFADAISGALYMNEAELGILTAEPEQERVTQEEVFEKLGGGNQILGQFRWFIEQARLTTGINAAIRSPQEYREEQARLGGFDEEAQKLTYFLQRYEPDKFLELVRENPQKEFQTTAEGIPVSAYARTGQNLAEANATLIEGLKEQANKLLAQNVRTGAVSQKELTQRRLGIQGVDASVAFTLPAILEEGSAKIGDSFYDVEDAVAILVDAFIYGSADAIDTIDSFSAAIAKLEGQIDAARQAGEGETEETLAAKALLEEYQGALAETIELTRISNAAKRYEVPDITDIPGGFLQGQQREFVDILKDVENSFRESVYAGQPDALSMYQAELPEEQMLRFGNLYQPLSGLPGMEDFKVSTESLRRAIEFATEQGGIFEATGQAGRPQIINFNFNPGDAMWNQVLGSGYQQQAALLNQISPGYEQVGDIIAVYANKQMELISRDNSIIQMLLSGIEENTQDVVDGIYNLPSDGTFMVPFAGYAFGAQNAKGGAGITQGDYSIIGKLDEIKEEIKKQQDLDDLDSMGGLMDRIIPSKVKQETEEARELSRPSPRRDAQLEKWGNSISSNITNSLTTISEAMFAQMVRDLAPLPNNPNFTPPTMDFTSLADKVGISVSNALDATPIALNIELKADFQTFLDSEVVGRVVKNYLTQEMLRKGDATSGGGTVSAVI